MEYLASALELIFLGLTLGPILLGIIIGLIKQDWKWGVASSIFLLSIAWGTVFLMTLI